MASLKVYVRALRLPFLTGSLLPVFLAGALAYSQTGVGNLGFLLITALGVAAVHLGGNLINDYYDSFGSDPINENFTPFSGGSRVIQNQELTAGHVRTLAYLCFAVGLACGLALILAGRPGVALVGLMGLLLAYLYSAAPVQLMSAGLGELAIFLAFGPLLTWGAYYVQTDALKTVGLAVGLPLAFLITAILWINQFPDLDADAAAAKRHLVVRLGLERSRVVYAALMLAPFLSLIFLIRVFQLPAIILAGLAALPLALKAVRRAWHTPPTSPQFVPIQALTIQTHAVTGLTLILALLLAAWWR
ncbi:MAG: prenyltransferase [Thermodesulfobacteriota bacterium]